MLPAPPSSLVLVNPKAAGGRARALAVPMAQWLDVRFPGLRCIVAEGIAAAADTVAAQPTGSRIVLVGGDGTVQAMLPALLQRDAELGLVPMGSGNDTARALGLAGIRWTDALAHALGAPATAIDVGECAFADRRVPFASSLTAGFDSAVGLRALQAPHLLRGLPRYLWATLAELVALRTWDLRVEADGACVHDGEALFASVLNTPSYGGGMPAVPHARIDDRRLDLLVAGRFGRAGTALMLPRLLAGRHLSHPRVSTRSFTALSTTSPAEVPLAADGEVIGAARAWRIEVRPAALRVVCRQPPAA
jgi:diacylglycerol kinase (ATP)